MSSPFRPVIFTGRCRLHCSHRNELKFCQSGNCKHRALSEFTAPNTILNSVYFTWWTGSVGNSSIGCFNNHQRCSSLNIGELFTEDHIFLSIHCHPTLQLFSKCTCRSFVTHSFVSYSSAVSSEVVQHNSNATQNYLFSPGLSTTNEFAHCNCSLELDRHCRFVYHRPWRIQTWWRNYLRV